MSKKQNPKGGRNFMSFGKTVFGLVNNVLSRNDRKLQERQQYDVRVATNRTIEFEPIGYPNEMLSSKYEVVCAGNIITQGDVLIKIQGVVVTGVTFDEALRILCLASHRRHVVLTFEDPELAQQRQAKNNHEGRPHKPQRSESMRGAKSSVWTGDGGNEVLLTPSNSMDGSVTCVMRCIEYLDMYSECAAPLMWSSPLLMELVGALYAVYSAGHDYCLDAILGGGNLGAVIALSLMIKALTARSLAPSAPGRASFRQANQTNAMTNTNSKQNNQKLNGKLVNAVTCRSLVTYIRADVSTDLHHFASCVYHDLDREMPAAELALLLQVLSFFRRFLRLHPPGEREVPATPPPLECNDGDESEAEGGSSSSSSSSNGNCQSGSIRRGSSYNGNVKNSGHSMPWLVRDGESVNRMSAKQRPVATAALAAAERAGVEAVASPRTVLANSILQCLAERLHHATASHPSATPTRGSNSSDGDESSGLMYGGRGAGAGAGAGSGRGYGQLRMDESPSPRKGSRGRAGGRGGRGGGGQPVLLRATIGATRGVAPPSPKGDFRRFSDHPSGTAGGSGGGTGGIKSAAGGSGPDGSSGGGVTNMAMPQHHVRVLPRKWGHVEPGMLTEEGVEGDDSIASTSDGDRYSSGVLVDADGPDVGLNLGLLPDLDRGGVDGGLRGGGLGSISFAGTNGTSATTCSSRTTMREDLIGGDLDMGDRDHERESEELWDDASGSRSRWGTGGGGSGTGVNSYNAKKEAMEMGRRGGVLAVGTLCMRLACAVMEEPCLEGFKQLVAAAPFICPPSPALPPLLLLARYLREEVNVKENPDLPSLLVTCVDDQSTSTGASKLLKELRQICPPPTSSSASASAASVSAEAEAEARAVMKRYPPLTVFAALHEGISSNNYPLLPPHVELALFYAGTSGGGGRGRDPPTHTHRSSNSSIGSSSSLTSNISFRSSSEGVGWGGSNSVNPVLRLSGMRHALMGASAAAVEVVAHVVALLDACSSGWSGRHHLAHHYAPLLFFSSRLRPSLPPSLPPLEFSRFSPLPSRWALPAPSKSDDDLGSDRGPSLEGAGRVDSSDSSRSWRSSGDKPSKTSFVRPRLRNKKAAAARLTFGDGPSSRAPLVRSQSQQGPPSVSPLTLSALLFLDYPHYLFWSFPFPERDRFSKVANAEPDSTSVSPTYGSPVRAISEEGEGEEELSSSFSGSTSSTQTRSSRGVSGQSEVLGREGAGFPGRRRGRNNRWVRQRVNPSTEFLNMHVRLAPPSEVGLTVEALRLDLDAIKARLPSPSKAPIVVTLPAPRRVGGGVGGGGGSKPGGSAAVAVLPKPRESKPAPQLPPGRPNSKNMNLGRGVKKVAESMAGAANSMVATESNISSGNVVVMEHQEDDFHL